MKHGPCPRCAHDRIYVVDEVLLEDYQSSNATYPFTLTAHYGATGESGFFGAKMGRTPVRTEAYVCASCGYTELYAKDLDVLARFAAEGLGGVRVRG